MVRMPLIRERRVCAFHTICNEIRESELFLFWIGGVFVITDQILEVYLDDSVQRRW